MSRSYSRLSIEEFGAHLLNTGDLDPVYIALYKMEMDPAQLRRFLIAYWCLYHVGAACYLSQHEGREFWSALRTAAENEEPAPIGGRWPRGSERRHWRGQQARKAVGELMGRYMHRPEEMVDFIASASVPAPPAEGPSLERLPFKLIADRAASHRSFGPWISFKIADMIDRLDIAPVAFDNAAVFMFTDPRKAALNLFRLKGGYAEDTKIKDEEHAIALVVDYLTDHFRSFTAPPLHDRAVGLQEVETILCKWKSHMNGHYPLYNDIDEIREGLEEWSKDCKTAQLFLSSMPEGSR